MTLDEMAIITPTCRQLAEAPTSSGASTGGGSEAEQVAQRVTFEVETPVTESTTVDSQQQQQPLSSESASGVHGSTDEAKLELDVVDDQLEDTDSGGASEASDSPIAHRLRGQKRPPQRYGEWVTSVAKGRATVAFALTVAEDIVHNEPNTFHEAVNSSQAASWVQAMTEEMESLQKNHTWDLVLPPK